MEVAIEEARLGLAEGGIPIGSVLVHQGNILGRGHNRRVQQGSTVLHCTSTMFSPPDHPPSEVCDSRTASTCRLNFTNPVFV